MSDPSNYVLPAGTWLTIDGQQWEVVDAFVATNISDVVMYTVRGAFGHDVGRMSLLSSVNVPVPSGAEPTQTIIEAVRQSRSFVPGEAAPTPDFGRPPSEWTGRDPTLEGTEHGPRAGESSRDYIDRVTAPVDPCNICGHPRAHHHGATDEHPAVCTYCTRRIDQVHEFQPRPRPATLAFLDTETTGLHPELHEVWEVGLIVREWRDEVVPQSGLHGSLSAEARAAGYEETEYLWQLPVDLGTADPVGLAISGFHDRRWRRPLGLAADCRPTQAARSGSGWLTKRRKFAAEFAELTRGAHLIGNVVDFDARRLDRLLRRFGALPEWHYHLIDVEGLAVGFVRGRENNGAYVVQNPEVVATPPWKSDELMRVIGIEAPTDAERHTALGDARWAMRVYDHVMGATR